MMAEQRGVYDNNYADPPGFVVVEGRTLTFDDIPSWCEIIYDGEIWLVSEKGDDIDPRTKGQHLELWSLRDNTVAIIHEDWVNYWLNQRRKIAPLIGDDAPNFD